MAEKKHGIPYSVGELEGASQQPMDEYHRELMQWAAATITAERQKVQSLRDGLREWPGERGAYHRVLKEMDSLGLLGTEST